MARHMLTIIIAVPAMVHAQSCRSPMTWPFNSTSIWNTPLGSEALFEPANLFLPGDGNRSAFWRWDNDDMSFVAATPQDPVVPWFNQGHWGGPATPQAYCTVTGKQVGVIHVPANYSWCNPGNNNAAAFLLADGETVLNVQPTYVCQPGAPVLALVPVQGQNTSNIILDAGTLGGHGGSGLSGLGGALRLGEILPGAPPIRHALQLEFYAHLFYWRPPSGNRSDCFSWPAVQCDGYALGPCSDDPGCYGGTTQGMRPGALLAVPPADAPALNASLTTEPARRLLSALSTFGAYVVDDTAWNASALATERGVTDEFAQAYGFPFAVTASPPSPWYNDVLALLRGLRVVANNAPGNQGGGGVPLAPPPPPFC